MNIFWLDRSPVAAARYHNNKHVVKMIVELAQLMSTAIQLTAPKYARFHGLYKITHQNHPCAVWVRAHQFHYRQVYALWYELLREYTHRYGRTHSCAKFTMPFHNAPLSFEVLDEYRTLPPLCMPESVLEVVGEKPATLQDVVDAYRMYYVLEKGHLAEWKDRPEPKWFTQLSSEFGVN